MHIASVRANRYFLSSKAKLGGAERVKSAFFLASLHMIVFIRLPVSSVPISTHVLAIGSCIHRNHTTTTSVFIHDTHRREVLSIQVSGVSHACLIAVVVNLDQV